MTYHYSFQDCLARAERITWRVEDLIGGDKVLDFSKPFLPETLARTAALDFLSPAEKLTLNHIRGNAYIALFALVEEFILPFVIDQTRPIITGEDYRARAFLEFAAEEAKHIQLFRRFGEAFAAGFATPCQTIGPPAAIAEHVLSQPPLSVALLTLHLEWMSQRHYLDSIAEDEELDPQFKDMLLHHWMEEHQHAQLDTLLVQSLAQTMSADEIQAGFDGYLGLGAFLDGGLAQQAQFDLQALQMATGRPLSEDEQGRFIEVQQQANRAAFIGAGMSHPRFLETLAELGPGLREAAEATVPAFS
jgi:hypothetical protein